EHLAPQVQVVAKSAGLAGPLHLAALQCDGAVGEGERQVEMVVDDDDRDLPPQRVEAFERLLDDRRRQTLERLIEEQHADVAGSVPRPPHHRLPSAGKKTARRWESLLRARKIL